MKIYEYISQSSQFNSFIIDDEFTEVKYSIGEGDSLNGSWNPIPVQNYFKDNEGIFSETSGDFPYFRSGTPVLSDRAWKIFQPYLKDKVEALSLITNVGEYYVLNVLNIIDALDKDNSQISYNRVTGRVSRVFKHVFKADQIKDQLIFKVPETKGLEVYVSEEFKKIVEENNLKGLDFSTILWQSDDSGKATIRICNAYQ